MRGTRSDAAFVRGVEGSWESNWSVLCDHGHGCCHGGAKVQLDVGTLRVWRCVGVGFSRRVEAGNLGWKVGRGF